jgi:BirA family biotin operon repressor/biotin-[acetyl-CoA-carboxylase] ligase
VDPARAPGIDAQGISGRTGWKVAFHPVLSSTNDEAARLRGAGAGPRTAVVATRQTAGRGRAGRSFASPPGGLYVSLLVPAAPGDLPGPLTAAIALAAAEAIEDSSDLAVAIKWPNDLWVAGLKVGGILLEAGGPGDLVVAGVGINIERVPDGLPDEIRAELGALEPLARRSVPVGGLLEALLRRADRRLADLADRDRRRDLEENWSHRLALVGEPVRCLVSGTPRTGIFRGASLAEGLLLEGPPEGSVRLKSEWVSDLRPLFPR